MFPRLAVQSESAVDSPAETDPQRDVSALCRRITRLAERRIEHVKKLLEWTETLTHELEALAAVPGYQGMPEAIAAIAAVYRSYDRSERALCHAAMMKLIITGDESPAVDVPTLVEEEDPQVDIDPFDGRELEAQIPPEDGQCR